MLGALCGALINVHFFTNRWNPLLKPAIWLIDVFYLQLKMIYSTLIGSSSDCDAMMVAARNVINHQRFVKSQQRMFLVPHCLRATECPAKSTQYGVNCVSCGKCKLGEIKDASLRYGYQLFILAGSSFVKSLVEEFKPEGVLLLGCPYEVNKVMRHLRKFVAYGLLLSRDGCVTTDVDMEKVFEVMRMAYDTGRNKKTVIENVGTVQHQKCTLNVGRSRRQ